MQKTIKTIQLAALCLPIILTACASGPQRGGRGGGERPSGGPGGGSQTLIGPIARPVALLFAGMDENHDMLVTRAELDSSVRTEWSKLAEGGDTVATIKMSIWLRNALGSPDAQPSTAAFDNNFDGVISWPEFETRLRGEFELLDKSGDGSLDRSELVFDAPTRTGGQDGGGGQQGGGQGPPRGGGGPGGRG